MPDSRTVLPAPKLLDLLGIRADANVITLFAKTSATTQLVAPRARSNPTGSILGTRGRWLTCPGKESLSPFVCASEGSSATK